MEEEIELLHLHKFVFLSHFPVLRSLTLHSKYLRSIPTPTMSQHSTKTYYEILGTEENANAVKGKSEDLSLAHYLKCAKRLRKAAQWRPDKNPQNSVKATKRFQAINDASSAVSRFMTEAHRKLSEAGSRDEYDKVKGPITTILLDSRLSPKSLVACSIVYCSQSARFLAVCILSSGPNQCQPRIRNRPARPLQ